MVEHASASRGDQARIEHLRFADFDGRRLRLSVAPEGASLARYLSTQTGQIGDLVKRATGQHVMVVIDTGQVEARKAPEVPDDTLNEVSKLPEVVQAMELFDATVIGVQDENPEEGAGG